jgi:hypothetical protein
MVQDLSQQAPGGRSVGPRQAVAGVMPPQLSEALVREVWPTVGHGQSAMANLGKRLIRTGLPTPTSATWWSAVANLGKRLIRTVFLAPLGWALLTVVRVQPAAANLGKRLIRTVFLAPLGWGLLAPLFLAKFAPVVCQRYTLTNRRLMVQRGWKPAPRDEVPLEQIDEVRLDPASYDAFYHSGTLEVVSGGKVALRLTGVPEPEGFRQAIVNAVHAWVPAKAKGPFLPASAPVKD